MPSARRPQQRRAASRLVVLALCGAIGAGALTGCETTQEKAAAQQAESERILEARAKRQAKRHHGTKSRTSSADGTKSQGSKDKSSRRHLKQDGAARHGQKGEG